MFWELEINVSFPNDVAFGVSGSIHVVRLDLSIQFLEGEVGLFHKFRVDETSSGAAVFDGGGFDDLIVYQDLYGDMQSSFIWESGKYMVYSGRRHRNIFPFQKSWSSSKVSAALTSSSWSS